MLSTDFSSFFLQLFLLIGNCSNNVPCVTHEHPVDEHKEQGTVLLSVVALRPNHTEGHVHHIIMLTCFITERKNTDSLKKLYDRHSDMYNFVDWRASI